MPFFAGNEEDTIDRKLAVSCILFIYKQYLVFGNFVLVTTNLYK